MARFDVGWRVVFVSVAALLLLAPLRDAGTVSPQIEYDNARQLFVHGQLEKCQRAGERGYARNLNSNREWAAKFQLLDAEVLLRRGMSNESLHLLDSFHAFSNTPQDQIRAEVVKVGALTRQHRLDLADQKLAQAESLCRNVDSVACGEAWRARGDIAAAEGKNADALQAYLEALRIARSVHDRYLETTADLDLGWLDLQVERFDESVDWSRKAYQIASELGAEDLA